MVLSFKRSILAGSLNFSKSFIKAATPDTADRLYQYFVKKLQELGVKKVVTGEFGTYMEVEIVNDGPVTIVLDTSTSNKSEARNPKS